MKVLLPDSATIAISPEQLQRARRVFEAAVAEQGRSREAVLSRECAGDAALRAWVEEMIAADAQAQPILDQELGLAGDAASRGTLKPGDAVGDYRIIREIGVGGMGAVYQAEEPTGGSVAIKVVRWYSHEISLRFQLEQSILSGLQHPNIARLLGSGTTATHSPYFVMEYVEGVSIDSYCSRNSLGTESRVRLFRQVCAAVSYLHQHLVVHRDLKPGNVLVTTGGVVKLVDFGIAKLLQTPDGLLSPVKTIAGVMTPDYASPEQIRGGVTSTLTDVYSLGVLLYELLTGDRPFTAQADRVHETLRRICEEEPQRPSAVVARRGGSQSGKLRGELDNILLKALQKEPERRYASVEQFDEDLRRYLDRQPVLAQGDSVVYRLRKFVVRHKGAVAAAAAMALLLSAGVVSTSIEAGVARRERARAELHAREAESAKAVAEQQRAEANAQRLLAESKAAEADRERANAERRLGELQKLATGVVKIYAANGDRAQDSSALIAENVRESLMVLGREQKLAPGLADMLDRSSATVQSYHLANDPSWKVPTGWTASETVPHEYRVGVDPLTVHGRKSNLFLRSLVTQPAGSVSAFRRFDATPYRGKRVRLTAFLRTESVVRQALLGLNAGGQMTRADVSGTSSWKKYELVIDVPESAGWVVFSLTLDGSGTVWADDFVFEQVSNAVPLTIRQPENLSFTESEKGK